MQVNASTIRLLLGACAALALLAACQIPGIDRGSAGPAAVERAERQAAAGNHAAAARAYEAALRSADPVRRNGLLLAAAAQWIAAGDTVAAERLLAQLADPVAANDAEERRRVEAELALARGQPERALQLLGEPRAEATPAMLATRARALFAAGRVPEAVQALIARERAAINDAAVLANQRLLLDGLRDAAARGADLRTPAGAGPLLAGWLDLGRIAADAEAGVPGIARRLQSWRTRYPAHPAVEELWRGLAARPQPAGDVAQQVALLLPLSGRAEAAGLAVRDGFLAAYYDLPPAARPRLRIYDVARQDAPSAYLQALADGSDFVVGPLVRDEVAALAALAQGRAMVLALNFLPDGAVAPPRFYQFALSPEEEARAAARRAVADGRLAGVALAPASEWGRRVAAAFTAEFTAAGGQLLDQSWYAPDTTDFNDLLRRLLRTSGQRGSSPRPDARFVFVAAQPVHGRLIRTQLRFNYAGALPVYATSDIYEPAGRGNNDLDGVLFPDMPWVLDSDGAAGAVRESLDRAWSGQGAARNRLHAFGYDAFRLVTEIDRLRRAGAVMPGLTGRLSLGPDGRVQRQLGWAQVVNGQPALLPPAAAIGASP